MTDSKAPWLVRGGAIALMMAAGIALAACSGGNSGLNEDEEATLQERLDTAEAEAAAAEEERRQAELEQARAEEREAAAERQRLAAEQRRQEAEADREAAEEERDELQDQITQINARYALDGLRPAIRRNVMRIGEAHAIPADSVVAEPRHGMTALITPDPSWGFSTAQRSSSSGWTVTRHTNSGHVHDDELVVYDNRGGQVSIPLVQEFRGGTRFQDSAPTTDGTEIMGGITTADDADADDADLIRSGAFPSTDGTDRTFAFNHDPDHTMAGGNDTNGDRNYANDYDRYRISGYFMNAQGHFECTGASCTIGRRGDRYTVIAGTWVFKATDRAIARIDDRSYAYFGWWRRDLRENETYSYYPFFGIAPDATTGGNQPLQYSATSDANAFGNLTGSATYAGAAIGQYAIYQPLNGQSGTGAFTADAELTANFGNDMLSGTVTNFSNDPSWSLTLNLASMAGGDVEVAGSWVNWTIDGQGTSDVRGTWDAEFYSESDYVGQVPDGVVGTFTAAFDGDINDMEDFDDIVGSIIGAFGADKQ